MKTPFPQSYWLKEKILCGGQYPGDVDPEICRQKLQGLLDCGIRRVLSLIEQSETGAGGVPFAPYAPHLTAMAAERGVTVEFLRIGVRDASCPTPETMNRILDALDAAVTENVPLYFHCWGGHGRTGTTAACYLIRHGAEPEDAMQQILRLREGLPKSHDPFEGDQAAFVRQWASAFTAAPPAPLRLP